MLDSERSKECIDFTMMLYFYMKWTNRIITIIHMLREIYVLKLLREILDYKDIRFVYLTLFEFLITYGIIGWGGAYNNALLQLQKCQNTIIKVACNKDWRYPTKKLFENFNVLNINNIYT